MRRLQSETFRTNLVERINSDGRFAKEAAWFDGSILLDDGYGAIWIKVYRGKVIDHLPFTPPLGYTFKISGASSAWDELVSGIKFTDLLMGGTRRFNGLESVVDGVGAQPGPIGLEGNTMEAYRVIESVYLISEAYAVIANSKEAAA